MFQAVGAGRHYLANNSPYRDAGTTNIKASLLSDLRTKTTYPPLLLTNEISLVTVLQPQASRDTDLPDYGYHYVPIDYAICSANVTNTTLVLTNGVALATFGNQGFLVRDYATLISEGSPQRPNVFARYYAVQEETTNWANGSVISTATINPFNAGNSPPNVRLRFTESNVQSAGGYHTFANIFTPPGWNFTNLEIKDSWIFGGFLSLYETNTATLAFTNSILEGVYHDVWPVYVETENSLAPKSYVYNSLLRLVEGEWLHATTNVVTWKVFDNLLDKSTNYLNSSPYLVHSNNAFYFSTNFYQVYPITAQEKVLGSLTYETGPLGAYYQPTNSPLINTGSVQNAGLAGLWHFTTLTNQVKETNSWLDIGFHYVAVNPSTGLPLDVDGDGLPDYFEDRNGNGQIDSGESDWTTYNSLFDVQGSTGLVVFTPIKE